MKRKCQICGMVRSQKDMVLRVNGTFVCFFCWNKISGPEESKSKI